MDDMPKVEYRRNLPVDNPQFSSYDWLKGTGNLTGNSKE